MHGKLCDFSVGYPKESIRSIRICRLIPKSNGLVWECYPIILVRLPSFTDFYGYLEGLGIHILGMIYNSQMEDQSEWSVDSEVDLT